MMRWSNMSIRAKTGFIVFCLVALLVFFPLRLALDLAGMEKHGVNARQVRGLLWYGRIDDLNLGSVHLGDVRAAVSPIQLLVGRVRLDIWSDPSDRGDGLRGGWTAGFNQRGMDDVTGAVPLGDTLAPLPVSVLEFDDVTIHFAGDVCANAEGRIRALVSGPYAGMNLSQGLSGEAVCDGGAVLIPLVSQTGMEKLYLRFWRDGHYTAQVTVRGGRDSNAEALTAAGLRRQGKDYVMTLEGRM